MVGFGSSLRISRRRGWEDAYLDYASLRLLLTQIEAVYEEEDWKRGGSNGDNDGIGQFGGLDDDDEFWLDHSIDERRNHQDEGILDNIWRMFSKRHRRKRRLQRRRREQTSAWQRRVEDEEEHGSNWVVSANHPSPRKNKKDKASHALDKRGWRSPGVTDYRDELFLVSDDDVAFGCDEDQDDWEDTDAEEEEEVDLYDEYDDVNANPISNYDNMNYDTNDEEERILFQTPTDNAMMTNEIRLEEVVDEETVEGSRKNSFAHSIRNESPNTTDEKSEQTQDPDRADSPKTPVDSDGADGVQSKYETFAAVAARKGVKGAEIMPGSPVEGWLDFLPGFRGKKAKQKTEDCKAELSQDKATPPSSKTSPALGFAETLKPSQMQQPPLSLDDDSFLPGSHLNYLSTPHVDTESVNPATPNSLYSYRFNERPVTATALGSSMPTTPLSVSPGAEQISNMERKKADGIGFGVSLNSSLLPSNETTGLLSSASAFKVYYGQQNQQEMTPTRDNRKARNAFYSFRDNHEPSGSSNLGSSIDSKRNQNMFSYYDDGIFSVSNSNSGPQQRKKKGENTAHLKLPTLTPVHEQPQQSSGYISSFITTFLLGDEQGRRDAHSRKNNHKALSRHRQQVKIKRKRDRLRRQQRIQRRRELVPENIRVAHVRASAITERFRGLLRAEVEKIILFANSRLGELSDTIGSLRYSSYEENNRDVCRSYPRLDDGGMHPCSSSDEEERDDDNISCVSSDEGNSKTRFGHNDRDKRHHRYRSDSSNEKDAATKRQLTIRDRLRISRPLFQKAGFLGEDYSLLSLVDEADAYTAIGIELMHLLKFVYVLNIAFFV